MDDLKLKQYLEEVSSGDAFDVKEVARRLNLSVWSVRIFVREGKIDALKVGRGYLIPQSALYAYIRNRVKPNFSDDEILPAEDKFVPSAPSDDRQDDHAESVDNAPQESAEEEPEEEFEPEPEPIRPRPTSFSDGFFG